jgi:hypothetical protein
VLPLAAPLVNTMLCSLRRVHSSPPNIQPICPVGAMSMPHVALKFHEQMVAVTEHQMAPK